MSTPVVVYPQRPLTKLALNHVVLCDVATRATRAHIPYHIPNRRVYAIQPMPIRWEYTATIIARQFAKLAILIKTNGALKPPSLGCVLQTRKPITIWILFPRPLAYLFTPLRVVLAVSSLSCSRRNKVMLIVFYHYLSLSITRKVLKGWERPTPHDTVRTSHSPYFDDAEIPNRWFL